MSCIFCDVPEGLVLLRTATCILRLDDFPVTAGHALAMPRRHVETVFDMDRAEWMDCRRLLYFYRDLISEQDPTVTGFNIGINCGRSADQTVFHAHIHIVPRRDGDEDDPEGAVRGAIPGRKS